MVDQILDFASNLIDTYALIAIGAGVGFLCGYMAGVAHATKVPGGGAKNGNSAIVRGNGHTVIQKN